MFGEFFGKALAAVGNLIKGVGRVLGIGGDVPGRPRKPLLPASAVWDESGESAAKEMIDEAATGQATRTGTKKWLTRCDRKVRPSHWAAHNQVVGLDEFFTLGSGAHCLYPRDESLPESEKDGCRCDMLVMIEQEGITFANLQAPILNPHDLWNARPDHRREAYPFRKALLGHEHLE